MKCAISVSVFAWLIVSGSFHAVAAERPKKKKACEAAAKLAPPNLLTPQERSVTYPPEISGNRTAILEWREANLDLAVDRAFARFLKDGQLLDPDNCESITGFNWKQLMSVGTFRLRGPQSPYRFGEGPMDFWRKFEKKVAERTAAGMKTPDFNPYSLYRIIDKDPRYASLIAPYRKKERARLIDRALEGIGTGETLRSAADFSRFLEVHHAALFRTTPRYKPSGNQSHLGRFDGYVVFLDLLEQARTERIEALEKQARRTHQDKAELANLQSFSIWRMQRVESDSAATTRIREKLFARDRPAIQKWVIELIRNLPREKKSEIPVSEIARAIQANRGTPPWGDIFPTSETMISQMLIGQSPYSPDITSRRLFDNVGQLRKAVKAELE